MKPERRSDERAQRRRRVRAALDLVVVVAAAVTIAVVVNLISLRQFHRWDVTAFDRYSLSDLTRNAIKGIDAPLSFTALFHGDTTLQRIDFQRHAEALLQLYADASPRVRVAFLDMARDPAGAEMFAAGLALTPERDSVVVAYRERTCVVTRNEMLEFPTGNHSTGELPRFAGEEPFTRAMLTVLDPEKPRVCFTTGHGERAIADARDEGFEPFAQRLRRDNYTVETVDLVAGESIPGDCRALVIAAPRSPFDERAAAAVRDYLRRPERPGLLVFAEPRVTGGNLGALAGVLGECGITVREDAVMLGVENVSQRLLLATYGADYARGDLTRNLETLGTKFPTACALEVAAGRRAKAAALIQSWPGYWGETTMGDRSRVIRYDAGEDIKGPVALAATAELPPPGGGVAEGARVIVFADADFASRAGRVQAPGNGPLATNAVAWAAHRRSHIGIPVTPEDDRPVAASRANSIVTLLVCVVGLPVLAAAMGGIIWWWRRRE